MEIQVGDYVRTKDGIINKIESIGNSLYWLENGDFYLIKNNSNKHAPNIIDLIEVGDWVSIIFDE